MGACPGHWLPMDTGLLGLERRLLCWHVGYWGRHVGFYGGINYGFGYTGDGYHGGYWNHGTFVYNTAVTNVNTTIIHNTYNKTVVVNRTTVNNVSFNGGKGGTTVQPSAQEKLAATEQHVGLTQQQTEHEHGASQNRELRASFNHGSPTIAATSHAALFTGQGVVPAKGLTTGPKSTGALANPALGLATPGSLRSQDGGMGPRPSAHLPQNGFATGPKSTRPMAQSCARTTPPGSLHAKHPDNGPKAFAHAPPGKIVGANGHAPVGPQTHQRPHEDKKPPKDQH